MLTDAPALLVTVMEFLTESLRVGIAIIAQWGTSPPSRGAEVVRKAPTSHSPEGYSLHHPAGVAAASRYHQRSGPQPLFGAAQPPRQLSVALVRWVVAQRRTNGILSVRGLLSTVQRFRPGVPSYVEPRQYRLEVPPRMDGGACREYCRAVSTYRAEQPGPLGGFYPPVQRRQRLMRVEAA